LIIATDVELKKSVITLKPTIIEENIEHHFNKNNSWSVSH